MANRKLIRPNLAEIKERLNRSQEQASKEPQQDGHAPRPRKPVPPEQTAAEAFYYLKQMNNKTAMVVVMDNGEELRGHIEWYDRTCIKVHREGEPNMLIYKHSVKYLFKQEEEAEEAAEATPRLVESSTES